MDLTNLHANDRLYYFGDYSPIHVANGGYLSSERISHYESIFGKLQCVKYKGDIVVNI